MKLPESLVRMAVLIVVLTSCGFALHAQETTILSVTRLNSQVSIAWRGPAGWDHAIQSTPLLPASEWTDLITVTAALDVNQRIVDLPAAALNGFYRIRCTPPPGGIGPRLFFTDLESGPNRGGQDDLGCFITLWGEGFGASRNNSTVTFGGQEVVRYVSWGQDNGGARKLDMIVVQPGSNVVTGNIEIMVNGRRSNPLPFTVRSGRVLFVATSGDDSNPGEFSSPFRTIVKAKEMLGPGDIAYVMDGVTQIDEDNFGAALSVDTSGQTNAPKALIAYPGATVAVGSTNLEFGIRIPNNPGAVASHWVVSKLVLRGLVQAMDLGGDGSSHWRIVGNDFSCPIGDGQTGCFAAALGSHIAFLGNNVHDISALGPQPSKQYHAVYFTTDTSHVEVGWNHIHDNRTCRAIQIHSSPLCTPDCGPSDTTGFNQFDIRIHDNLIHGDICDGINLATVDPSKGAVLIYNNVIYDVGTGPSPPDGDANYAGIHVAGGANNGQDGAGNVEVFNNTLYNCGARASLPDPVGDEGMFSRGPGSPNLFMRLRNNIAYAVAGEEYLAPSSTTSLMTGSHNLWFGSGAPPAFLPNSVNADPQFMDLIGRDFSLRPGSPAIDAGIDSGIMTDFLGMPRPQGPGIDVGAYEFMPQSGEGF
jgi:hypothetical protein